MAILKNPGDNNCRNYGSFEEKKYRSFLNTIFAIMAILKKIQLTADDNVEIVEKKTYMSTSW